MSKIRVSMSFHYRQLAAKLIMGKRVDFTPIDIISPNGRMVSVSAVELTNDYILKFRSGYVVIRDCDYNNLTDLDSACADVLKSLKNECRM